MDHHTNRRPTGRGGGPRPPPAAPPPPPPRAPELARESPVSNPPTAVSTAVGGPPAAGPPPTPRRKQRWLGDLVLGLHPCLWMIVSMACRSYVNPSLAFTGSCETGPHAEATRRGPARVFLKGGGSKGGCGGDPPPPPSGDPELLEAPKAPKKIFGLN